MSLKSAYGEYPGSGARSEPPFTTLTATFKDTIDYIFYEHDKLSVHQVMLLPDEETLLAENPALPSAKRPSDHLPLKCTFRFN